MNCSKGALVLSHVYKTNQHTQKKKAVYIQAMELIMLAKTEGGPAGCHSSSALTMTHRLGLHTTERSHWAGKSSADRCGPPPQAGPCC